MRQQTSGRWTAEARRFQRERGKQERRRLGFRVDQNSSAATDSHRIPDPPAYLEQQRSAYIGEIEACARACEIPKDRAGLFLKLLRLASLGRTRVDVHGHLEKLMPEPNLSKLTNEQLDRILRGESLGPWAIPRDGCITPHRSCRWRWAEPPPHAVGAGSVRSAISNQGAPCVYAANVPAILVPGGASMRRSTSSDIPQMSNGFAMTRDR